MATEEMEAMGKMEAACLQENVAKMAEMEGKRHQEETAEKPETLRSK